MLFIIMKIFEMSSIVDLECLCVSSSTTEMAPLKRRPRKEIVEGVEEGVEESSIISTPIYIDTPCCNDKSMSITCSGIYYLFARK